MAHDIIDIAILDRRSHDVAATTEKPRSFIWDGVIYAPLRPGQPLLESEELIVQAANNSNAQFASSPTLAKEIMNAVMDALTAHTTMSKQARDSEQVREGLKDLLLGPAQLYEALREKAVEQAAKE
jgi:hypothetical protein